MQVLIVTKEGDIGAGKTPLLQIFEWSIFGQVQGNDRDGT